MPDLREQLARCHSGRVCLVGLGNPDYGDDGFGVRLAEALADAGASAVVVAGAAPERVLGAIADQRFDSVIFLDAVEFGGAPGSVVFLGSDQMAGRFPQISTHKMALGTLAKWIEANGTTRAWLLGAQPESLKPGGQLTPVVRRTLERLAEMFGEWTARAPGLSAAGWRPSAIP